MKAFIDEPFLRVYIAFCIYEALTFGIFFFSSGVLDGKRSSEGSKGGCGGSNGVQIEASMGR